MKKRLQCVDGETLANTILPPIRFVIHELLPQGLHVLAGAPKVGKSWLSLWICLCVAQGEKLWDFPTQKGSVLYLCLEDSYARIQNRLLDLADDAPGNLFFSILSEKLHEGLEEQLESFRKAYMVPLPAKKLRRFHKRVRMHRRKQAQSLQEELSRQKKRKSAVLGMLLCILVTLLAVTVGAFYESLSNFFVEEEDDTTIVQITQLTQEKTS